MLYVVLDTNAINIDRPLASNAHAVLLEASADGRFTLCVPQVVVDEAVNKWRERAEKVVADHRNAERRLRGMGVLSPDQVTDDFDFDELADGTRSELQRSCEDNLVYVAPLPEAPHRELLDRALRRAQPFDAEGKDGYRDVLLWETLLAVAEDADEVLLVSADVEAFFESKSERRLSDSLALEARVRLERPGVVRLVETPRDAVNEVIGRSEDAERLFSQLMEQDEFVTELVERMDWQLGALPVDLDLAGEVLPTTHVLEAELTAPGDLDDFDVRLARASGDGLLRVDFEATTGAVMRFKVPAAEYTLAASTLGISQWSIDEDGDATGELPCVATTLMEAAIETPPGRIIDVVPTEVLTLSV